MKKLIILLISFNGYSQQVDKVAHFGVGYVASATTSALMSKQTPWKNIAIGIGSSVVLGTAKELYDYNKKGVFNYKDLGATVLGGVLGSVTIRWTIRKTV